MKLKFNSDIEAQLEAEIAAAKVARDEAYAHVKASAEETDRLQRAFELANDPWQRLTLALRYIQTETYAPRGSGEKPLRECTCGLDVYKAPEQHRKTCPMRLPPAQGDV